MSLEEPKRACPISFSLAEGKARSCRLSAEAQRQHAQPPRFHRLQRRARGRTHSQVASSIGLTWSIYAIVPGRPRITHSHEADPKEARRKVEAVWAHAEAHGIPAGNHIKVEDWSGVERLGRLFE